MKKRYASTTMKVKRLEEKEIRIIISGGGTGGHVYPAIAIANAIKRLAPDVEILFVGAQGKLEMEKVPQAGYRIEGLWISGFQRKLTLRNLMFPIKLLNSLWKARRIVRHFDPNAVVGVGGYASGPVLEMATRMKIPSLIQEQNSYAGVTNKLLSKKASKICVAYSDMGRFFPKEKVTLTGNPVRKDILDISDKREEGLAHFGLKNDKKTIVVVGGSLGARTLNDSMAAALSKLQNTDIQVFWQAGKLYIEEFEPQVEGIDNVKITAFIDRMDLAYAMADVVISRAGALTISELCLVGKPAILVPSPNVSEDHQTANAKALVEKNAAILVKDADAKETMIDTALDLLNDQNKMEKLSENIKALGKPDAANTIAKEVLKLAKKEGLLRVVK